MTPMKPLENSVTRDIINKIHFTLSDLKSGEAILSFLRATEPLFIEEVNRFMHTEMNRIKFHLTEAQSLYIGSIIGATYVAGFLMSREATYQMFNGLLDVKSSIKEALNQDSIDKIIDKNVDDGKSYKEIASLIRGLLEKQGTINKASKKIKSPPKKKNGKRFKLGDLS